MRSVAEYLEKAAEFDELARSTSEPVLKKRYADVAESYRLLAIVWQRLIETGALKPGQQ
jgi:serine acetyltransferase